MSTHEWNPFNDPNEPSSIDVDNSPRRRFGDLSGILAQQPIAEVAAEAAGDAARLAANAVAAAQQAAAPALEIVEGVLDLPAASSKISSLETKYQDLYARMQINHDKMLDTTDGMRVQLREHDTTFEVHSNQLRRLTHKIIELESQANLARDKSAPAEPNATVARHGSGADGSQSPPKPWALFESRIHQLEEKASRALTRAALTAAMEREEEEKNKIAMNNMKEKLTSMMDKIEQQTDGVVQLVDQSKYRITELQKDYDDMIKTVDEWQRALDTLTVHQHDDAAAQWGALSQSKQNVEARCTQIGTDHRALLEAAKTTPQASPTMDDSDMPTATTGQKISRMSIQIRKLENRLADGRAATTAASLTTAVPLRRAPTERHAPDSPRSSPSIMANCPMTIWVRSSGTCRSAACMSSSLCQPC